MIRNRFVRCLRGCRISRPLPWFPKSSGAGLAIGLLVLFLVACGAAGLFAALRPAGRVQGAVQSAKDAGEFIAQGFDLLARNDAAKAAATFRKALEFRPDAEPAHRGLGLALQAQGQLDTALAELQVATRLDPADADAHYALGVVAWLLSAQRGLGNKTGATLSAADYRGLASEEFNKALALQPHDVSLRLHLADLYLEAARPHDALLQAEEAARLAPDNPAVHVTLGRAYFAGGEEEKAASEFDSAAKLDPRAGAAFLELGQLRFFQRKFAAAELAFRQAIQASPNLAPAYAALAQVLAQDGRTGEARGLLERAVSLDPQDWESQYQLANVLLEAGEAARAKALLENVSRLHPEFLRAREQLALGLLRRGDLKGAGAEADSLIALKPQAPEGHRLRALVLWKERDYEMSLAECAMALASEPDSTSMLALQSIALWQLDRKREGQQAFRQAGKAEPKVGSAEVFCRLLLCDARDIGVVSEFLRRNRWVLAPTPEP